MKRAVVAPAARSEFDAAAVWYEGRESGLGRRFVDRVAETVDRIAEAPRSFPTWDQSPRLRKAVVPRFPHAIFFLEKTDTVEIVAIAHTARMPGYWRRRT